MKYPKYPEIDASAVAERLMERHRIHLIECWQIFSSQTVRGRRCYAVLCDYRRLTAFSHAWQVAVYDGSNDRMIDRFNVKR